MKSKNAAKRTYNAYSVARISANFLKRFGLKSLDKPSLTASLILFRLTRYVDVDFKIQVDYQTLYKEMGMRSDVFQTGWHSLLNRGLVIKKIDGYYVTEKSHVVITEGSDELFAPNLTIFSDCQRLGKFKPKTVNFLYYLIGNTVSPRAKYTRTYQVCSLYSNKFKKENVGFNLFNSLKELLASLISLASEGLIEAKFTNKITNQEYLVKKDLLSDMDEKNALNSILAYLGYEPLGLNGKLTKNNRIQDYKVIIKVLVDPEDYYPNTANFMEFKNELSIYGLAAENIFSNDGDFSFEDNEMNLFISIKNQLIQLLGNILGTQIYRNALRYFLSEKYDRLFSYYVAGTGKATNIFKKYYLMPYLQQILFSIVERIKLEGEAAFNEAKLKVAAYNTTITHEQLNDLINWLASADLTHLVTIQNRLSKVSPKLLKDLISHYPSMRKLTGNYKNKLYNLYKKYVIDSRINMDMETFENEIINTIGVLDHQAKMAFESLVEKIVDMYSNIGKEAAVQQKVAEYQNYVLSMQKKYLQTQIEYAINKRSTTFNQCAPEILNEIVNEFLDELSPEKLMNLNEQTLKVLIKQAEIKFDLKLKSNLIDHKSIEKKVPFYNWLDERE